MVKRITENPLSREFQSRVDFEAINKIRQVAGGGIHFLEQEFKNSSPHKYRFEVRLPLITGLSIYGIPEYRNFFLVELTLPPGYPYDKSPECKITPAPFHPFVQRSSILPRVLLGEQAGKWIEPKSYHDDLGKFIVRIINSLRFENIEQTPEVIANGYAYEWFCNWKKIFQHNNIQLWFPTAHINLPDFRNESYEPLDEKNKNRLFNVESSEELTKPNFQVVTPKSFQILETKPGYKPEVGIKPQFETVYPSICRNKISDHLIFIQPNAFWKIVLHIGWGRKTIKNSVEQGGILLGRVIRDSKGRLFGIVEEAVPGESATGSGAYLEMSYETWKSIIEQADPFLENHPDKKMTIIGWYHTHPNDLDVFMSGTDRATQEHVFSQEWQFAVVLNPHKKIWRVFRGVESEECQGLIVSK